MSKDRKLSDRYLIKRLAKYFFQSKKLLLIVLLLMIFVIFVEVYIPLLASYALDDAIANKDTNLLSCFPFMGRVLFVSILLSSACAYSWHNT